MKRLIISGSLLLILAFPAQAQKKPTYGKRNTLKLLSRRETPARSPVPAVMDTTFSARLKASDKPDSARSVSQGQHNLVWASRAIRTSPEALLQAQHIIPSYYVDLAYNKTVSIIFPTAVRSVDLGSRSIMADKAADVENVLKVKASQIGFNETNFSVMTADGKFYSFVVNYNETPSVLALNLAGIANQPSNNGRSQAAFDDRTQFVNGRDALEGHIQFAGRSAGGAKPTQSDIVYASNRILHYRGRGKRKAGANKMQARLRGVYVKDNVLYYRLAIENESNLHFDIDYVRYFVVDSKTTKLTSRQEIELLPIYVHNEAITTVRGHQKIERVYAFQRFTIPNNKQLLIVIGEQNGGRELAFQVQNKDIMKARPL